MTTLNHLATGTVVALTINNPVLAIVLAYISHFVLDAIPHLGVDHSMDVFERNKKLWFKLSVILNVASIFILLPLLFFWLEGTVSFWVLGGCLIAANLPDLVWVPRFISEIRTGRERPRGKLSEFHVRIQRDSLWLGGTIEVIWLTCMVLIILRLS